VAEPELRPVYLLTGSDRPKIELALRRLRGRFDEVAVETLAASEAGGEDAVAACNAMGLFGERRLVLVEGVESWKAADVGAVEAYLGAPAPATVLALVGEGIKKDSRLAKACARGGDVLAWDVQKDLAKWVAEQFARLGATAEPEACRSLVDLVGEDTFALASEVDKLATWAAGDEISARDVEELVDAQAEPPRFALTDAWERRQMGGVLAECERLLEKAGPSESVPLKIGSRLHARAGRIREVSALEEAGVPAAEIASRLKLHPYAAKMLREVARNFTRDELDAVVVRLAGLDYATKGGSRLPDELELARALVDVTRSG
jgi:DNA polymerase-3 subunit delta